MLLCSKGVIFSKQSEIYILLSHCKFLWNIFFFFSLFLPSVQQLLRTPAPWMTSKWAEHWRTVPRCSSFSLIISPSLMFPLTAPSLTLFHSKLCFVSTSVTSCFLVGHYCNYRDCCSHWCEVLCSHLMGGLLYRCFAPIGCDPGEEQSWLPLHSGQSRK